MCVVWSGVVSKFPSFLVYFSFGMSGAGIALVELVSSSPFAEVKTPIRLSKYWDQKGTLPTIPRKCPNVVDCCSDDPKDRPAFEQIIDRLLSFEKKK